MNLAERITSAMATWSFIFIFLAACVFEILWNHTAFVVHHHLSFDPSTIILNLVLSLIAAVQGSIIMIAQNGQARRDAKRDDKMEEMTANINRNTEAVLQFAQRADVRDETVLGMLRVQAETIQEQTRMIMHMSDIIRKQKEE